MTAIEPRQRPQEPATLEEDYELLKQAVRDAGALALSYFRQQITVNRKPDGSEVSEADLAVDTALKLDLAAKRPDYGWLSEESLDDGERLKHARVWMVDPIDGTNAFLRHVSEWTVSAALVEDGVPVLGAVFNPATRQFFSAMRGKGAFLNDKPIKVSDKSSLDGALLIASGGLFKKKIWKEPWPEVQTRWVNSVAYRLALVACGEADATISLSAKSEWDLAAAAVILTEAGGIITDHKGKSHPYNSPSPRLPSLVASGPKLHPLIIERTNRVDL
ncbi:3'(2'),5'-bisphosphate nucleotidase CysQ [Methyloceanibacter sp.]|uniref:inositol monophosphatase family protein n=1 Tax=Methyloceanibacter sp. TaxID=1965321 RepID=UPI002D27DC0E|nr:3'(2'),5'-bisphosphate nucleotidase CysQ [Methyloceanibacter sp.]HZP10478.1 3'(2'),5'-bisphosphate nucleotidase CysQ [Methyloceanibacter sp.]